MSDMPLHHDRQFAAYGINCSASDSLGAKGHDQYIRVLVLYHEGNARITIAVGKFGSSPVELCYNHSLPVNIHNCWCYSLQPRRTALPRQ